MARMSLAARLTATFLVIMTVCFVLVGLLLYRAAEQRGHEQDDTNLVLSARHLRRLVAELDSLGELKAHQDRMVISVLGDTSNALRIVDDSGQALVDYNPSGFPLDVRAPVPADQRVVADNLRTWRGDDGVPIRGVAVTGQVRDGAHVTIVVARSLSDREAVLHRYGRDMALRLLAGMVAAIVLSHLLVRRALRPLRAMASDAAMITAQSLQTRLSAGGAPAELHALTDALNAMLDRLEGGFTRVWQFTVDLAHDLRTPIGNLRGTNEVALTRTRTAPEYQALLGSNIEECDRVSRTIENVLFLARADNPQFALQCVSLDVAVELERIAEYFEGIASERQVAIQTLGTAHLSADRDLFRRAVSNLLSNALRYTPPMETITLRTAAVDDMVVVAVENPGDGIPPEHREKLFDRFYRVDRSRSDSANSTGLGLSIVKSVMELHGGRVAVESEVQGVTRFVLWFPNRS
ncbi:MAG TPA: heavy metal sensor histidine kinase [Luteibacter sp.]|uniref:heavy metal sensor histidine kinase n=1 Tax=Luteibacter sp. TaxID=1886636 RepID=UPI002D031B2A|nr:heavy metal sensor histidine kinase [Luteibacter sp.]HVI55260.1 heavy metal sensor histidine kinase [Luteibacter sp.]